MIELLKLDSIDRKLLLHVGQYDPENLQAVVRDHLMRYQKQGIQIDEEDLIEEILKQVNGKA